jgi:mannan endo-1,4-beta-mannosidase
VYTFAYRIRLANEGPVAVHTQPPLLPKTKQQKHQPCGTSFCTGPASNPVPQRFAGTNAFYLMLDHVSDADVRTFMQATAGKGANLIRFFAFSNGPGEGSVTMANPIQPSLGTCNEAALRRMDLILAEARSAGLRVIMPLANFEPEMGGMDWFVEQVKGAGQPKELFYTDAAVKDAYWTYVSTVLSRTNTLTGVRYVDDPTIFSIELANEPHTTNRWEADAGLPPGALVRDWVWEMAGRVKGFPGFKAMVSTGEEGYRSDGEAVSPHNVWINGGFKGVDFVGNTACPNVSFATIHVRSSSHSFEKEEQ